MNQLSDLLSGHIVERQLVKGNPVLVRGIDNEVMREVLEVLTLVTNDV